MALSPGIRLAAVLTARSVSDRVMATHEMRSVPIQAVWMFTGNNLRFKGDCARRILPCGIDPKMENPELRDDFVPRLRHRIYDVDDERVLHAYQSGTPALTVLGIAILLSALAWAPVFRGGARDIVLEPILVDAPEPPPSPFTPVGSFSTKTQADLDDGLWENTLLYDYSVLYQRHDQRARRRRIADYGR